MSSQLKLKVVLFFLHVQIYLYLADVKTEANTKEKVESRVDNLQKAADALDLAIARLTPEHEVKVRRPNTCRYMSVQLCFF